MPWVHPGSMNDNDLTPPNLAQVGEHAALTRAALLKFGIPACLSGGFLLAGFVALHWMARDVGTSPWDHATPQDLVWYGARLPVLAMSTAILLMVLAITVGRIGNIVAKVRSRANVHLSSLDGPLAQLRATLGSLLLDGGLAIAVMAALASLGPFVDALDKQANREVARAFEPRAIEVRLDGEDAASLRLLRGRLGDYYVFTAPQGPQLVPRSDVKELRPAPGFSER